MKKAIVLFSGGLDSTVCLSWALSKNYKTIALTFDYGQRHIKENLAAKKITTLLKVPLYKIKLNFPWLKKSSLVDKNKKIPDINCFKREKNSIPSTYVPGRNLVFVSIAASFADAIGAEAIICGPNAVDYSGYPDCRPEFYKSLQEAINKGTKNPTLGRKIELLTPIINMSKAEIVKLGIELKAPLQYTWSCYKGGKKPCGHCDSCKLRAKGFKEANVVDPAL